MMKAIFLASAILVLGTNMSQAQVVVIVNKSVGVSTLSASETQDLFTLATKEWKGGGKVTVFDLKVDAVKDKFYGHIGKSASDIKKIWMRVQLSGEGKAPEAIGSEEDLVEKVGSTAGAVGFVSESKVKGNVKIVARID